MAEKNKKQTEEQKRLKNASKQVGMNGRRKEAANLLGYKTLTPFVNLVRGATAEQVNELRAVLRRIEGKEEAVVDNVSS